MINLAAALGLGGKRKNPNKDTAVGNVPPHSHDNSQNNNAMQPIGNITGNANQNSKLAELGEKFFQGDQFANQYASRPPVDPAMPIPPQPDPISDPYGKMFSPFSKKPVEKQEKVQEKLPTEKVGVVRETPNKINKPGEMPERITPPTNMMIGVKKAKDPKSKYREPLEGVSGLQDLGAVKSDKKGQYVVNRNPESVRDTLRFPKGTTHYSGNPYKVGQTIDETDYERIVKEVNKS